MGLRDRLAVELTERQDAILAVLLDGALEEGDRATLLRLMDQAFGRVRETLEVTHKQGSYEDLTPDEIDAQLAQLLAEHHDSQG